MGLPSGSCSAIKFLSKFYKNHLKKKKKVLNHNLLHNLIMYGNHTYVFHQSSMGILQVWSSSVVPWQTMSRHCAKCSVLLGHSGKRMALKHCVLVTADKASYPGATLAKLTKKGSTDSVSVCRKKRSKSGRQTGQTCRHTFSQSWYAAL